MKLPTVFRTGRDKRSKHPATPTQPVPVQPAPAKELAEQDLEQVQGGVLVHKHIAGTKYED